MGLQLQAHSSKGTIVAPLLPLALKLRRIAAKFPSPSGPAPQRQIPGTAPEPPPSPEHVFCDIFCDLKPQGFLSPAAKANEKYPLLPHPGILYILDTFFSNKIVLCLP